VMAGMGEAFTLAYKTGQWHSHMDSAVDPVSRLNPDHPHEDHRAAASP
jgi:hypothetical protein